jgi:hypothetical protein
MEAGFQGDKLSMNYKNLTRLAFVSLALGWIFDLLFWKHSPGISILIFVLIYLAGLFYLTFSEGLRPPPASYFLVAPILFFAVFTALRLEPFTVFVCLLLLVVCLLILSMTWMGGRWVNYSLMDYVARFFLLIGGLITLGSEKILSIKQSEAGQDGPKKTSRLGEMARKVLLPIIGGLIIAAPALFILGGLLASADPIFAGRMEGLWKILMEMDIWDLVLRTFLILLLAYAFSGAFLFSILKSNEEKLLGQEKPVIPRFFNWVSAATVIASVDLLFAFFVYIQFRYFFGGQANISTSGYTYAEYARQGFNELLMVAFLSLLLYLSLSTISRRADGPRRHIYTSLGVFLVLLVGVILVSAYQRLNLYEAAYGFSRIRTYSHVFIIWMGILLVSTVYLEIADRLRAFALTCLLAAMGFGMTLSILNVDGFIVRQNLARQALGYPLDTAYLVSLSDDALPDLARGYSGALPGAPAHNEITGILHCRLKEMESLPFSPDWQSFHWSHHNARQILEGFRANLANSQIEETDVWLVVVNGQEVICHDPSSFESRDY